MFPLEISLQWYCDAQLFNIVKTKRKKWENKVKKEICSAYYWCFIMMALFIVEGLNLKQNSAQSEILVN